jgi:hypothetical protein
VDGGSTTGTFQVISALPSFGTDPHDQLHRPLWRSRSQARHMQNFPQATENTSQKLRGIFADYFSLVAHNDLSR